MVLGLSLSTFTTLHVVLSLIGIASGVACLLALLASRTPAGLTSTFLLTTVATSVTGFFFPNLKIGPAVIFGVVSLVVLIPVLLAFYHYRLAGPWRWVYIAGAAFVLYLNSVV